MGRCGVKPRRGVGRAVAGRAEVAQQRIMSDGVISPDVRSAMNRLGIVTGDSRAFVETVQHVVAAAPSDRAVLFMGETGSGKQELARLLHDLGPRSAAPYVEVSLGAVLDTLFTSELFGDPGTSGESAVERAAAGTLVLNELGHTTEAGWQALSTFFREPDYWSTNLRRRATSTARLVLLTNLRLLTSERVDAEFAAQFQDLFAALRPILITVPPLAERREDLERLARASLDAAVQRYGLAPLRLSPEAVAAVERAEWPGNVRQLTLTVERAAMLASNEGTSELRPEDLFPPRPAYRDC
jgi:Nif-specific regulatory protein